MNRIPFFLCDYRHYFFTPRLLVFLIFQFTVMHYYLRGVAEFSLAMDYPVSVWLLPFLFQIVYMQFTYGVSVVYFFSTVPFFQREQMYVVVRQGRARWMRNQVIRIWLTALLLPCLEFLISILIMIPHIDFTTDWGNVLYSLAVTDAAAQYGVKIPMDYGMMNHFSAGRAMLEVMGMMFLITGFLGMLMLFISVASRRSFAVIAATAIAIMPIVAANLYWKIPVIVFLSPFSWLNRLLLAGSYRAESPSFGMAIVILMAFVAFLAVGLLIKIRRVDFQWTKED